MPHSVACLFLILLLNVSQVALSEKSQDAVIALGIFFLDSGCSVRCADNVVPYLVRDQLYKNRSSRKTDSQ